VVDQVALLIAAEADMIFADSVISAETARYANDSNAVNGLADDNVRADICGHCLEPLAD
jgi:hypothetical protein